MRKVQIRKVSTKLELERAWAIRMHVFVQEQGVPAEIELDSDDQRAVHFLAIVSGKAVGTARVVQQRASAKIGRMAVVKSYRGKGVGRRLLQRAITTAKKSGAEKIYLHAQVAVVEFYESCGFRAVGAIFDEAGIPHRKMVLKATGNRH